MKKVAVLVSALALAACVTQRPEPVALLNTFSADDVAYIHQLGDNKIRGQAFMRQRGGGVVTCAGRPAHLIPAGSYAAERIYKIYGTLGAAATVTSMPPLPTPPAEYIRHTRTTQCDAGGRFTFSGVADGEYFITALVTWEVAGRAQGGPVMAPVRVFGGETRDLIIAP